MPTVVLASPESTWSKKFTPTTKRPSESTTTKADNIGFSTTDTLATEPVTTPFEVQTDPAAPTRLVQLPPVPTTSLVGRVTSTADVTAQSSHPPVPTNTSGDARSTSNSVVPSGTAHADVIEASQDRGDAQHLSGGVTAAIVVGVALLLAAIAFGIWFIQRKKRHRKQTSLDFSSLASSYEHALPMTDLGSKGQPSSPPIGLDTWLSYHGAGNPRASVWPRMQSPSPQPAVAEVQSFTRTQRKPRMCDIGSMKPTLPLVSPVSKASLGHATPDERMTPTRAVELRPTTSYSWSGMATPLTPGGEFAPTWPSQEAHDWQQDHRPERDGRWY